MCMEFTVDWLHTLDCFSGWKFRHFWGLKFIKTGRNCVEDSKLIGVDFSDFYFTICCPLLPAARSGVATICRGYHKYTVLATNAGPPTTSNEATLMVDDVIIRQLTSSWYLRRSLWRHCHHQLQHQLNFSVWPRNTSSLKANGRNANRHAHLRGEICLWLGGWQLNCWRGNILGSQLSKSF